MTPRARTVLAATLVALVAGACVWAVLSAWRREPPSPDLVPAGGDAASAGGSGPSPATPAGPGAAGSRGGPGRVGAAERPTTTSAGGGVPPGLRTPSGETLTQEGARDALRRLLSEASPDWGRVGELLAFLTGPLDGDLRRVLLDGLAHGDSAHVAQALAVATDPSLLTDLLALLDDASLDGPRRRDVLVALVAMPGKDRAAAVEGLAKRTTGDYVHDLPLLQAVAQVGGPAAARTLVDAIARAPDPDRFGAEVWRGLDLRGDAAASDVLAEALADAKAGSTSPAALRALVDLAGRPGASPRLVDALAALAADGAPSDEVRRQALSSLAGTGDEKAVERLLATAGAGGPWAAEAARALARAPTLSDGARERVVEAARTTGDDALRQALVAGLGSARAAAAVPLLADLAVKGSDAVRKEAVVALSRLGPRAAPALPALRDAFGSGDEALRTHVANALGEIGTPQAGTLLDELRASEPSPVVRRALDAAKRRLSEGSGRTPP